MNFRDTVKNSSEENEKTEILNNMEIESSMSLDQNYFQVEVGSFVYSRENQENNKSSILEKYDRKFWGPTFVFLYKLEKYDRFIQEHFCLSMIQEEELLKNKIEELNVILKLFIFFTKFYYQKIIFKSYQRHKEIDDF